MQQKQFALQKKIERLEEHFIKEELTAELYNKYIEKEITKIGVETERMNLFFASRKFQTGYTKKTKGYSWFCYTPVSLGRRKARNIEFFGRHKDDPGFY